MELVIATKCLRYLFFVIQHTSLNQQFQSRDSFLQILLPYKSFALPFANTKVYPKIEPYLPATLVKKKQRCLNERAHV